MVETLANMTQVIVNSPQVNTLVAGEMAAAETARRQAQIEQSQKFQDLVQKTVQAMEGGHRLDETDPDSRRRQETRREQRERRRQAAQAERARRAARLARSDEAGAAADAVAAKSVIDICV